MKYLSSILIGTLLVGGFALHAVADYQTTTIQAALNPNTPPARSLDGSGQLSDLTMIDLTALYGDTQLRGFQIGTDVAGGLNNFSEIRIYDAANSSVPIAYYSSPGSAGGDTVPLTGNSGTITVYYQRTKTFIIRGTLNSSAAGTVRIGFKDLVVGNSEAVTKLNIPIYGNAMTLPGKTPTPIPTPLGTPIPSPTATASPMPLSTPVPKAVLSDYGLQEGNTISATGSSDPDVYIVNAQGYKRLFLNPVIFSFYGHLGGFAAVKSVSAAARDAFPTSGLFTDCQVGSVNNNGNVYAIEVTGEDTGTLHHVAMSGSAAVAQDPQFFNKVFCINDNEFNWYTKSSIDYTSLSQVPVYHR